MKENALYKEEIKKLLKKPRDSVEQQVETLVQRVFGL